MLVRKQLVGLNLLHARENARHHDADVNLITAALEKAEEIIRR